MAMRRARGAGLLAAVLFAVPALAQTQPASPPTRNVLGPLVPYEQGMANIEAREATRPKATPLKRPGEVTGPRSADQPAPGSAPTQAPRQ